MGEERASGKLRALNDESRITAGGVLGHVCGPRITISRDNHIYQRQSMHYAGHIPMHVDDVYGISVCVEKYVILKLSRIEQSILPLDLKSQIKKQVPSSSFQS